MVQNSIIVIMPASAIQIISLEGNIGSGKSTLLENLRSHFADDKRVLFLKEPVSEWETICDKDGTTMLQKFYADQKKYSFPFQMMAYISRLVMLKNAIKENPEASIFITERSLYTDKYVFAKMLYDMGNIEEVNYQIYMRWFDAFAAEFPITKVVYVRTDPHICHERIRMRSREGEDCIPLDYLNTCHEYHESMVETHFANVKTIHGNVDIRDEPQQMVEWIRVVEDFIA